MTADRAAPAPAPLPGVILAAGRSSRMGRPKALLVLDGAPCLDRLVATFHAAGLTPVVVVASGAALAHAQTLIGVVAIEGDAGQPMIDSLARALKACGDAAGVVVQPVDAAFTTPRAVRALIDGFAGRSRVLTSDGAPGHPVLAAARAFPAILARAEGGLRAVLTAEPAELVPFDDPRILADLDTPADVARWTTPPPE